jgi:hypothetical protein
MNQTPQRPESDELELLQHYRQHAQERPSAELDARILAAAREAAASRRHAERGGLLSRLRAWLFAGSPRARWSVAFASLATVGLGLGLSLRTLERAPSEMDAMPPLMAPAPVSSYAAPPMLEERALSRRQLAEEAPGAPAALADMQSAPAAAEPDGGYAAKATAPAESAAAMAPRKAEAAKKAAAISREVSERQFQQMLREVLELRRQGDEQAAQRQLRLVQHSYPQRDLAAELERLEREEQKR